MCGIYGMFQLAGVSEADVALCERLSRSLQHRGPNGGGQYRGESVIIGMRRLSIIDIDHGRQPLWNETADVAVVANGEIYNFVELRSRLESLGHCFRTGSDCETIVHAYEQFGDDFLRHLRGMFAFALLDLRNQRMVLARDRLGEKPLYLAERGGRIVFSSELRSLVMSKAVGFELSDSAVKDYLMWGFVPEPSSAICGTRKLGAGCRLDLDLRLGRITERKWWSAADVDPISRDPASAISEVLGEIGTLISRSDVPVGVALSGGVDSNLIAALAVKHRPDGVHAFTVGYEGSTRFDERQAASSSAARLGLKHVTEQLKVEDVADGFPKVCTLRDEPIADISGSGYFALMRMARDHGVPVMLFGQGGDELFWGYPWAKLAVEQSLRKGRLLVGAAGWKDYLRFSAPPRSYPGLVNWILGGFGLANGLRAYVRDRQTDPDRLIFWDVHDAWRRSEARIQRMTTPEFQSRVSKHDPASYFTVAGSRERPDLLITELLLRTYLLGNGINQCDRLSMACSVECRLPLVDYRLVEIALGLQKAAPDWRLRGKARLMAGARDLVHPEVFRRHKRGFTPPWRLWMQEIFRRYGSDLWRGELYARGLIPDLTGRVKAIDMLGRPNELIIPLLILEEWARGMKNDAA